MSFRLFFFPSACFHPSLGWVIRQKHFEEITPAVVVLLPSSDLPGTLGWRAVPVQGLLYRMPRSRAETNGKKNATLFMSGSWISQALSVLTGADVAWSWPWNENIESSDKWAATFTGTAAWFPQMYGWEIRTFSAKQGSVLIWTTGPYRVWLSEYKYFCSVIGEKERLCYSLWFIHLFISFCYFCQRLETEEAAGWEDWNREF